MSQVVSSSVFIEFIGVNSISQDRAKPFGPQVPKSSLFPNPKYCSLNFKGMQLF